MSELYDCKAARAAAIEYERKARFLRQIHSSKLERATTQHFWLTIVLICASVLFAFISIAGEQLRATVLPQVDEGAFKLVNDAAAVIILLASIFQLGMNLPDRILNHLNSVKRLTEFIVDMDDIIRIADCDGLKAKDLIQEMNKSYKALIKVLPESGERDYKKAKSASGTKTPGSATAGGSQA